MVLDLYYQSFVLAIFFHIHSYFTEKEGRKEHQPILLSAIHTRSKTATQIKRAFTVESVPFLAVNTVDSVPFLAVNIRARTGDPQFTESLQNISLHFRHDPGVNVICGKPIEARNVQVWKEKS